MKKILLIAAVIVVAICIKACTTPTEGPINLYSNDTVKAVVDSVPGVDSSIIDTLK